MLYEKHTERCDEYTLKLSRGSDGLWSALLITGDGYPVWKSAQRHTLRSEARVEALAAYRALPLVVA